MKLTINGEEKEFTENDFPVNLSVLVASLKMEAAGTVAEVDGEIVRVDDFACFGLKENMKIELVRFVGGG